jgi:CheY-like chemotaxis protein
MNKLWIIDDDEIFRYVIDHILSKYRDLQVSYFENGKEAQSALEKNSAEEIPLPKLMLIDVNMPIMSGWKLIEFLQTTTNSKKLSQCKIVMMSSSKAASDLERFRNTKVVSEYIQKPISAEKLNELIENYLH